MGDVAPLADALRQSSSDGFQAVFQKEIEAVRHQESGLAHAALGQANRAVKRRQDFNTLASHADESEKQAHRARAELQNVKETLDAANHQAERANQRQKAAKARVEGLRDALALWESYAQQASGGPATGTQSLSGHG